MLDRLLQWDQDTFIYLNSLGLPKYDSLWSFITEISSWTPLFLLFIILFFIKFSRKTAWSLVLTFFALVLFITGITKGTKILVKRLRPCNEEDINSFIRILKTPTDYSFFSGHASSSFALTVFVFLVLQGKLRWAWIFFIWPLLFSLSRIYVGVHYPLDIVVGALVGTGSGILFYRLHQIIVPYKPLSHP